MEHNEEWEKEFDRLYIRGDLEIDISQDERERRNSVPLKALKSFISSLLTKTREEAYQEGQDAGAQGKFFSSIEMTEPLPKKLHDKIFQAGRLSLKAEIETKVKEKKFKVAKNFETESHAGYFYKGYNSAISDLLSLLTSNTDKV